jgi:Na+/citrate or Na+/malate symporter
VVVVVVVVVVGGLDIFLFGYWLILYPVGFSTSHGFIECIRNKYINK